MALDNLITIEISSEKEKAISDAAKAIRDALADVATVNLTNDERRQYGRVSDTNKAFIEKCKEYMELNPETMPRGLDKSEFDKDYAAARQLETPIRYLTQIIERMSDTKILLDHDNYNAAISYYRYVKYLANSNEPGSTSIYDDLRKRFQSAAKPAEDAAPAPAPQPEENNDAGRK